MEGIKKTLERLPSWLLTGLCLAAVLWLTLSPRPLGDTDVVLFPGADKVAHGLMFGGFAFCLCLDRVRRSGWPAISGGFAILAVGLSALLAVTTEILQFALGMGRSFEWLDILADISGAIVMVLVCLYLEPWKLLH